MYFLIQALYESTLAQQMKIDETVDAAQAVVRTSGDNRTASQAAQLASKFQTLQTTIKELLRRWETYTTDHEVYETSYQACVAWQTDFKQRIETCGTPDGDKHAVQQKLEKMQVCNHGLNACSLMKIIVFGFKSYH